LENQTEVFLKSKGNILETKLQGISEADMQLYRKYLALFKS
jgi:hypothetical protein